MITCLVCSKEFHEKGFNSHYQRVHGGQKIKSNNANGSLANKENARKREEKYNENPKLCKCCSTPFSYTDRHKTFCNSSCAAIVNNTGKIKSDETKKKLSEIQHAKQTERFRNLVGTSSESSCKVKQCSNCAKCFQQDGKKKYCSDQCKKLSRDAIVREHVVCKIVQCDHCKKYFEKDGHKLYCSESCKTSGRRLKILTTVGDNWNVSKNRGRHKRSYLEKSFDDWLVLNNIPFHSEYVFKRYDSNGTYTNNYFADFYFPHLNLIIELDGTQHKNTIQYDADRDAYISATYNVRVIRVSHREYVKKLRYQEICDLLGVK